MAARPGMPRIADWLRACRWLAAGGRSAVRVTAWRRKRSVLLLLVVLFLTLLLDGLRNWIG